jgi:hypothetical protein
MSVLGITPADFTKGKYELHTGMYHDVKIQAYIDKYERIYLLKLLGSDLYQLFVGDLIAGVPQTPIYFALFQEFDYDTTYCKLVISDGMIEMVKGFVYFNYLKDETNQVHVTGVVRQKGENSTEVSNITSMIYTRYNDSVRTFKAIQTYICDNLSNYPDFNGKRIYTANWI